MAGAVQKEGGHLHKWQADAHKHAEDRQLHPRGGRASPSVASSALPGVANNRAGVGTDGAGLNAAVSAAVQKRNQHRLSSVPESPNHRGGDSRHYDDEQIVVPARYASHLDATSADLPGAAAPGAEGGEAGGDRRGDGSHFSEIRQQLFEHQQSLRRMSDQHEATLSIIRTQAAALKAEREDRAGQRRAAGGGGGDYLQSMGGPGSSSEYSAPQRGDSYGSWASQYEQLQGPLQPQLGQPMPMRIGQQQHSLQQQQRAYGDDGESLSVASHLLYPGKSL